MKCRIWMAGGLLSAALLSAAFSAAVVFTALPDATEAKDGLIAAPAAAQDAVADKYTVADENGKIGVYYMGELMYLTDIRTDGLREIDKDLLGRGIETSSYEDVLRLLEDFGS